jgi:hypothetical protein
MLISLILKSTLHPLTISLIILGCLFVITFLFFSIVFAIHCNSLHIQYRLEEKFNKIKQFLAINKFKYLETLSKSNVQLKDLMMDINNAKQLYEEQLEVVRQKIISLTLINARYLYLRSHRLANEIKKDLKKCNAMMKNLRNVSISATQYSKDVSDLLIEYRQITDDVTHFYEFNLALRYDNQLFKKMRETIKDAICQATEYVLKFNNDKLLVILHSLDQKISSYYKIILQVYTFDRILMYLESLRKRIKSLLDNAAKILSNTDYSQIETTFANGSSNTTQLETNLKSMNFGAARINAIVAVKQLSDALAKIEMGDQTNVLIQKDMVMLKNQIAVLTKEFNELNTALNNIQKNFRNVNDSSIINKITILNGEIKAIILSYQNLENEYKNYHLIQRNEFLIKIKELSNSMLA